MDHSYQSDLAFGLIVAFFFSLIQEGEVEVKGDSFDATGYTQGGRGGGVTIACKLTCPMSFALPMAISPFPMVPYVSALSLSSKKADSSQLTHSPFSSSLLLREPGLPVCPDLSSTLSPPAPTSTSRPLPNSSSRLNRISTPPTSFRPAPSTSPAIFYLQASSTSR